MTRWEIIETTEYMEWFDGLIEEQQKAIRDRVGKLRELGPTMTRPYVDHIKGSRYSNMKELRVSSEGALRILFIFDPQRNAVLLLGGNKAELFVWNKWYARAIQQAELIYERHLRTIKGNK